MITYYTFKSLPLATCTIFLLYTYISHYRLRYRHIDHKCVIRNVSAKIKYLYNHKKKKLWIKESNSWTEWKLWTRQKFTSMNKFIQIRNDGVGDDHAPTKSFIQFALNRQRNSHSFAHQKSSLFERRKIKRIPFVSLIVAFDQSLECDRILCSMKFFIWINANFGLSFDFFYATSTFTWTVWEISQKFFVRYSIDLASIIIVCVH